MQAKAIADVVAPIVERCGLELDDVSVLPAGKRSVVRIVVDGDGPKGRGPRLDDIAACTREISTALDQSSVTGQASYTLEVSTRGTSAPLLKPAHWRRNRGRLVSVTCAEEKVTGRIRSTDDDGAVLDVDGQERRVAFADVTKAVIQVELNRPFDPDLDDDEDDEMPTDELGDETEDEE